MNATRKAAVAGAFYPADANVLNQDISQMFREATYRYEKKPIAVVAPHAGYAYSGPTAAQAYRGLQDFRSEIETVVILGPSHRVPFVGIAASTASAYETPLGAIPIQHEWDQELKSFKQIGFYDDAHVYEHSLEVHLPFLKEALGDFQIIPLVVGDSEPQHVGEIIEHLLDKPKTLIVISSDLSHYHPYEEAKAIDSETARLIETLDYQHLSPERACGCRPLAGLLKIAKDRAYKIDRIEVCNSGDTAGDKSQVVGYGAFALYD